MLAMPAIPMYQPNPNEELDTLLHQVVELRRESCSSMVDLIVNLVRFKEGKESGRVNKFLIGIFGSGVLGSALVPFFPLNLPLALPVLALGMCFQQARNETLKYRAIWVDLKESSATDTEIEPMVAFEKVYRLVNNKFPDWACALRDDASLRQTELVIPYHVENTEQRIAFLRSYVGVIKAETRTRKINFIGNILKFNEAEELKRCESFGYAAIGTSPLVIPGIAMGFYKGYAESEARKYRDIWRELQDLTTRDTEIEPMAAFERAYRQVNNKFPEWAQALGMPRNLSEPFYDFSQIRG